MNHIFPRRATLSEVAAAARVSRATVSRYLNASLTLPSSTAERIDVAVRRLNYTANPQARRLSLGRTDTIGLVIPDLSNPFFAQIADAAESVAKDRGLTLLLHATRNQSARERDALAHIRQGHMDGVLFMTNHVDADGLLAASINAEPRIVLIDEDVADTSVGKVLADNHLGGWLAGRHLVAAGHRRLAVAAGPANLTSTVDRLAGFRAAVAESGVAEVVVTSLGDYTAAHGCIAARSILARVDITAIFATSDEIAIGLLETLQAEGVAVPEALSLVAFDDSRPLHLFRPAITAIRQPVHLMAERAVDLLIAALQGKQPPAEPIRVPVSLIERASVRRLV